MNKFQRDEHLNSLPEEYHLHESFTYYRGKEREIDNYVATIFCVSLPAKHFIDNLI